jgi:hypothetical protein
MSNWGGPLTAEEVACFLREGITTAIIAMGPGAYGQHSHQQAREAVAGGMKLETYHYLPWTAGSVDQWVKDGLDKLGDLKPLIRRTWLNVEDTNTGALTLSMRVEKVDRALATLDAFGKPAGIWTASWFWPQHMGNTDRYKGRLLANSYYDGDPDVDGLPYGGWTRESVAIEQFGDTRDVCGQSVDVCYVYKTPTHPDVIGEEPLQMPLDMLTVSVWGVDTEETLPWATRVANANYRMAQALAHGSASLTARLGNHEALKHLTLPQTVTLT